MLVLIVLIAIAILINAIMKYQKYKTPPVGYVFIKEGHDVFTNHFGEGTSFINLDPYQAQKELDKRKRDGDLISDSDWKGYQDIIASNHDKMFLEKVDTLKPMELYNWFFKQNLSGIKMSSRVWKKVSEIMAPDQERSILVGLTGIPAKDVKLWVACCKKNGFFFTEKAYAACKRKYMTGQT